MKAVGDTRPLRSPGAGSLFQELTAYELRNLVAHLVEAQRLDELRWVLTLETADTHNAWYEVRVSAGELAAYVIDVSTAMRAVQALPMNAGADSAIVTRLEDQYLYALVLTSLNSSAANVPPALLTAMRLHHLITPNDAMSYARRATDAIQRAEALIDLLPAIDESERPYTIEEIVREVEASRPEIARAEQSKCAEVLASLVPHVSSAERPRIVNDIIRQLEEADAGTGNFVGPIVAVRHYLTAAQAEYLFDLAGHSADDQVRAELLRAAGATANGELLDRVVAAARKISFSRMRASVLIELAPRLTEADRVEAFREAIEAALEWKSPHQLGELLDFCSDFERSRLLEALIQAAALDHVYAGTRAEALLKASVHITDSTERHRLVNQALDATERLAESDPPWLRLASLARLAQRLPRRAKARLQAHVLAAARTNSNRVEALTELIDYAEDREAALAEAFKAFRESGPIGRSFSLKELAPRLSSPMLLEALRIVQPIGDHDEQGEALAALSPYLLCSPTDTEVAEAVAAARAVHHEPLQRDILIALAGQVAGAQRAFVLDAALNSVHEHYYAISEPEGLVILAPSLDYAETLEVRPVWERAVRIASEIHDAADRAEGLAALGSNVGREVLPRAALAAPGPHEVLADGLRAARGIEDYRPARRAAALVTVGKHLPEADRSRVLQEASDAAWLIIQQLQTSGEPLDLGEMRSVNSLAVVAAGIEPHRRHAMVKVVTELARRLPDHHSKADALATIATCYPEPHKSEVLHEAVLVARKEYLKNSLASLAPMLQEPDRSATLSDALPEARKHGGYAVWSSIAAGLGSMPEAAAYRVLRNSPGNLTTLPRKKLLGEIMYTAPIIFALGGRYAIAKIVNAVKQTAHWWP
jgi:hypothetical protein